ncbi:hypothetical protein [Parasitella parasitica]|uniref:Uncharacterized protein n=1 Tax=Parasitella parasitica TaxID=35722 RepID=A0A0B7MRD5_9FUNG|nr:hypothetical protein [Parasitella parasitica]
MGDRQEDDEDEDENENERGTADDEIDNFGWYTMEMDDGNQGDYHRNAGISEDLSGGTSTTRQTYFEKVKVPKNFQMKRIIVYCLL